MNCNNYEGKCAKIILSQHKCQVCSNLLMKVDDKQDSCSIFFDFKLYEGCNKNSLCIPSQRALVIFSECRELFACNFSQLMSSSGIIQKLCELCVDRFHALPCNAVMNGTCMIDTVRKCILFFVRVLFFHKIKLLNRDMSRSKNSDEKSETTQKRNRKAMKVLHS